MPVFFHKAPEVFLGLLLGLGMISGAAALNKPAQCYSRIYGAQHLKAHARQRVKSIFLEIYNISERKLKYFLLIDRKEYRYKLFNVGSCEILQDGTTYSCLGDSGGNKTDFSIDFRRSRTEVSLWISADMYMFPGKGSDAGDDGPDDFGGADDKLFVLHSSTPATCRKVMKVERADEFLGELP